MAKRGTATVLAAVPLFGGLSRGHLKRVADIAKGVDYMAGAPIVKEGDPGDSFFVVVKGQAKVTAKGRTVRRLVPGDYFGEIALLDGGDRSATVRSETPMTLLEIKRNAFVRLVRQEPTIALGILKGLARLLRQTERSLRG